MPDTALGILYVSLLILTLRSILGSLSQRHGHWRLQKLFSQSDVAIKWMQIQASQAPKSMLFPWCHTASKCICLETNFIFCLIDKHLRFGEGKKKENVSYISNYQGHIFPSTPPPLTFFKLTPLWPFFFASPQKASSAHFFRNWHHVRYSPLWWLFLEEPDGVFPFPSCFYFLYCLPPWPHTHMGVFWMILCVFSWYVPTPASDHIRWLFLK